MEGWNRVFPKKLLNVEEIWTTAVDAESPHKKNYPYKVLFITSYFSWHVCSKTYPPLTGNVQIWKNSPTNMSFLRLMCSRCGSIPLLGEKWPERSHPGNKFGWPSSGHLWGLKRLMPCVESGENLVDISFRYCISYQYVWIFCLYTVYTGKDFIDYTIQPEPIANLSKLTIV